MLENLHLTLALSQPCFGLYRDASTYFERYAARFEHHVDYTCVACAVNVPRP
jgi:hypothetical protein